MTQIPDSHQKTQLMPYACKSSAYANHVLDT